MNIMSKKIIFTGGLGLILVLALWWWFKYPKGPQPLPSNQWPTPTVVVQVTKTTGCVTSGGLPDSACTPGAVDTRVAQTNIGSTICIKGYTQTVRPPVSVTNKIKQAQMLAYGDTDSPANYELDHLIPLELGGCPDCVTNLWPEPYAGALGAKKKDIVEDYLHKQVCGGLLSLESAQTEIANNWVAVYQRLGSP